MPSARWEFRESVFSGGTQTRCFDAEGSRVVRAARSPGCGGCGGRYRLRGMGFAVGGMSIASIGHPSAVASA